MSSLVLRPGRRYLSEQDWRTTVNAATLPDRATLAGRIAPLLASEWRYPGRSLEIATVSPDWEPPEWFVDVANKAFSLLGLPENWDTYGGNRIREECVERGLEFLAAIVDPETSEPSVVPSSHGGLQFEWHKAGLDLEIEIEAPDRLSVYCYDRVTNTEWESSEATADLSRVLKRLRT